MTNPKRGGRSWLTSWFLGAVVPCVAGISILWIVYASLMVMGFWAAPLWGLVGTTAWWVYERAKEGEE